MSHEAIMLPKKERASLSATRKSVSGKGWFFAILSTTSQNVFFQESSTPSDRFARIAFLFSLMSPSFVRENVSFKEARDTDVSPDTILRKVSRPNGMVLSATNVPPCTIPISVTSPRIDTKRNSFSWGKMLRIPSNKIRGAAR